MIVNRVNQKIISDLNKVISYQILTYCFFKDITITNSEMLCLTLLSFNRNIEFSKFCKICEVFKNQQSTRNVLLALINKGLVVRNNKRIKLNDDLSILTDSSLLLDFKILGVETNKSQ